MPKLYTIICAIALFAIFMLFATFNAEARIRCGKHTDVVKFLGDKYKESRVGMGLINAGQMMELYISEQGSWTMLITRPDGVTCFGPVGKNWKRLEIKPVEDEPA